MALHISTFEKKDEMHASSCILRYDSTCITSAFLGFQQFVYCEKSPVGLDVRLFRVEWPFSFFQHPAYASWREPSSNLIKTHWLHFHFHTSNLQRFGWVRIEKFALEKLYTEHHEVIKNVFYLTFKIHEPMKWLERIYKSANIICLKLFVLLSKQPSSVDRMTAGLIISLGNFYLTSRIRSWLLATKPAVRPSLSSLGRLQNVTAYFVNE